MFLRGLRAQKTSSYGVFHSEVVKSNNLIVNANNTVQALFIDKF